MTRPMNLTRTRAGNMAMRRELIERVPGDSLHKNRPWTLLGGTSLGYALVARYM